MKMLETIKANKKAFTFVFLCLMAPAYILNSIYSEGYYHYDEHYQILEFAKYKLGETKASQLPWEFHEKMRPAIQPAIAYAAVKIARSFSSSDAHTNFVDEAANTLLRFISGVLGLICFLLLLKQNFPAIQNKKLSYFLLLFSLTLWFLPYCSVRFSSENWSGIFFWFGFYLITQEKHTKIKLLTSGIFLALAFQFRYQMGLCIAGLFLWLWIIRNRFRINRMILIPLVSMALMILLVTIYIDQWFYDEPVIPAYNYLYQNIILGKSAGFSQGNALFIYFIKGAEAFILPFGIFFILAILYFLYARPKHPITWALLPFILVHLIMANKQIRFMFPLVYILPIMISHAFHLLYTKYPKTFENIFEQRWLQRSLKLYIIINAVILINRSTYPANTDTISMSYIKQDIQQRSPHKKAYLVSIDPDGIYRSWDLALNFYRPKNLEEIFLVKKDAEKQLKKMTLKLQEEGITYFYLNTFHTRFYKDQPPFPEYLRSIENQCEYLFNVLDNKRVKYNIYRLIRQIGHIKTIYLCQI